MQPSQHIAAACKVCIPRESATIRTALLRTTAQPLSALHSAAPYVQGQLTVESRDPVPVHP